MTLQETEFGLFLEFVEDSCKEAYKLMKLTKKFVLIKGLKLSNTETPRPTGKARQSKESFEALHLPSSWTVGERGRM